MKQNKATIINMNAGEHEASIWTDDATLQRKLRSLGIRPHMYPRKRNDFVGAYRIPAAWLSIQPKQKAATGTQRRNYREAA